MEILQTLIVAPLSLLYEGLFELVQLFVHNLGPALLVLSLVTAFLMIPVEKAVRRSVDKESLLKEVMLPQLAEIKAKYKGRERNDAIKDLYYRYRYNPLYSIRSSLGILVQIPFLLGAFWMLSSYAPLNGSHFWKIKDLGIPDGLLLGINLLPILMTVINLATIVVSRLSKRDAVQALVIALLFLVLLYDAPSALLLYWTSNNVIHFLRALVKRYYKCLKLPHVKTRAVSFIKSKAQFLSSRIDSLAQRIGLINAVFVVLLVFGVLLRLIGVITHKDGWRMAVYLDLALMISVLAIPVIKLLLNKVLWTKAQILKRVGIAVVLFFSLCTVIKILGLALLDLSHHHQGRDGAIAIILLLLIANPEFVKICLKKLQIALSYVVWLITGLGKNKFVKGKGSAMFVTAVGIICATCFVIIPLRFYVQNFQSLWFTGSSLFTYVLGVAIVSVLALTVIKRLPVPRLLGAFALMLATCVVIQSFIWPQQVKEFIGNEYDWLGSPLTWTNLAIWGTLLTLGVFLCLKKKAVRHIAVGFSYLILIVVSISSIIQSRNITDTTYETVAFDKKNEFDLGEQNTIVFLLDTLDQATTEEIANTDHEKFAKLFRGFTWYKNNLGSGPLTSYAIPYIFTSVFFQRNEEYPHYITRAYTYHNALDDAKEEGFDTRIYSHGEMFPANAGVKIVNAVKTRLWGYSDINTFALKSLQSIVLYNFSPDFLRMYLPMDSDIFDRNKPKLNSGIDFYHEDDPKFYDDFDKHPFAVNKSGKQFIFYHLRGAHGPFRIDINGRWIAWNKPDTSKHDQVLGCFLQLQKMFERLQEIGKFKDSTIVVMSDHGYHFQVRNSYPILFVKPAGVDIDSEVAISNEPTGHKDLISSLIKTGKPSVLRERVVLDRESNLWRAPDVLNGDPNSFVSIEQHDSVGDNFTTEGFDLAEFWGRRMFVNAAIHFREPKEEFLKLIFNNKAPECNGYVNFEENGKNKRFYVGGNASRVIYKRTGQDIKITPECRTEPYISNEKSFRTFDMWRMKKYGLYEVLTEKELINEFFSPQIGVTTSLGGKGPQGNVFLSGIGWPEDDGRWSLGKVSQIVFKYSGKENIFTLKLHPFTYGPLKEQHIVIKNDDGKVIKKMSISSDTDVTLNIADFINEFEDIPLVKVTFDLPNACSPNSLTKNKDTREIAVKFLALTVSKK